MWPEKILSAVDPRLQAALRSEFENRRSLPPPRLEHTDHWVLAGHRAAGKSTLLPLFAQALKLPGVDLDAELERRRPLKDWLARDPQGFRAAEREAFLEVSKPTVVAVGGGFLSLHADLLRPCCTILVPVSFETYCERLEADTTRPRLRPALSVREELHTVFLEREGLHQSISTVPLVDALLWLEAQA